MIATIRQQKKRVVDKDNSDSGVPKLSGENCHVGSMESENDKMYRSQGSVIPKFFA